MSVASLELCRTLHELSGWDDTRDRYYEYTDKKLGLAPAYDLGYLLRKLPKMVRNVKENEWDYLRMYRGDDSWTFSYHATFSAPVMEAIADTPEDAACKLAIELFKQGILTKEGKS